MAKIDVNTIEGYAEMTPEQKIAALEGFEYEDHSAENERLKNAVSKANGEAANWKKKHNELLSEDERKKSETEDALNEMREQLEEYKKRDKVNTYKTKLIADGYDETLADETANALANGDMDKFFANQKTFLESHDKAYKAQLMGGTPTPPPGKGTDEVMTLEKFHKLSMEERAKFSQENPEEYKSLYSH